MTEMQKTMAVFSGSVNPMLADGIVKELGIELGAVKLEKFANGEIYARYEKSVRGADVFLVQSVCAGSGYDVNDALMELLIMADAAKRASARSVCAIITHYGYARQERKAAPREPITARLVADGSVGWRRPCHRNRFAPRRYPGLLQHSRESHDGHAAVR